MTIKPKNFMIHNLQENDINNNNKNCDNFDVLFSSSCLYKFFIFILNFQEARNIEDFLENFKGDPTVKIPRVYKQLSGSRVLVMEWIDGIRCTDPQV